MKALRSVLFLTLSLSACTQAAETPEPARPGQPSSAHVSELGKDFVYGNGIGNAAVNVGTTILFPPYGLYVLGNALITATGYDGFYVTDLLPAPDREEYNHFYDTVTSGPGRVAAAMNEEEFRNRETVKENFTKIKAEILKPENDL